MLTWRPKSLAQSGVSARWRNWFGRNQAESEIDAVRENELTAGFEVQHIDFDPDDPLLTYLEENPRVTLVARIPVESPAVESLRRDGVEVVVPLVTHGKLVGVINLGARLSGQAYSRDDLTLLENLALQSSAPVRVAQLVREQQEGLREHERIAQQLRLARDIQKTLLPKTLPDLPGWHLAAYYQPAWEVGGDFYDFIHFPDNQLGIIIGDVTDKGMPSALVMASTRSLLRASAERDRSPSAVLASANRALVEDIPPRMFVTCFYLLLNPENGHLRYANAGHDLPFRRRGNEVRELRATGMPLGLMPDMPYDEVETYLEPGETVVFSSDGLVEAHDPSGEMLGTPRVRELLASVPAEGPALIRTLLDQLAAFTGPEWRQEDDVTLVTLTRSIGRISMSDHTDDGILTERDAEVELARFLIPSAPGNEVLAIEQVSNAVADTGLPLSRLEALKTAVGEAVMNGMEHGNRFREDLPVEVSVSRSTSQLFVRIYDAGNGIVDVDQPEPDLDAKLAGLESPRGWGLFLIRSMVDEMRVVPGPSGSTTELILNLSGDED